MNNQRSRSPPEPPSYCSAGWAGLALSEGSKTQEKAVAEKPVVRTKVIRQTVHVTKHAKPKHVAAGGAGGGASAGAAATTSSAGSAGATTGASSAGSSLRSERGHDLDQRQPAKAPRRRSRPRPARPARRALPVTTASSGAGGGGGEYESEGGGGGGEHEGGGDD